MDGLSPEDVADEEEKALWQGMTEALNGELEPEAPPEVVPEVVPEALPVRGKGPRRGRDLLDRPPEILVAYICGQPEAVAAIGLLKEAQRVWNERKIPPEVKPEVQQEALDATLHRRRSSEDICIAYSRFFRANGTPIPVQFRRRFSSCRKPSRCPSVRNVPELPLGSDAASFQRRRQSRASAIFLVSPSGKEKRLVPEAEESTPGERRRRRTISIIATVGAFLLVISILLVTITLRLATHIDDIGNWVFFFFCVLKLFSTFFMDLLDS